MLKSTKDMFVNSSKVTKMEKNQLNLKENVNLIIFLLVSVNKIIKSIKINIIIKYKLKISNNEYNFLKINTKINYYEIY